mmetsp:Transcript_81552/g.215134  ORF Transcript_81552/g.215134 Transcript_81552/m.215134 type:complete len:612 (+) Transcript_81552:16-1851(+)
MAPRRGGEGGAGALAAIGGGRGAFDPPPLKRMYPWQQDGAGQCDIVAGGVDDTGVFKGIHISGVHLMALLRTFQLSKVFMPVDTSTPIAHLGQSLQDGIPLVIVTRGCFGRDMDYGPGPVRNDVQKTVWEICRQMRADMPQVLISCIDLPINVSPDVVQACLSEPLNEYRELMYHEGTWHTPSVINSSGLAKWKQENKKEKLNKVGVMPGGFHRKKFGWLDETVFYKDMWALGWKPVLKRSDPPAAPRRTDLVFSENAVPDVKPILNSIPSGTEVTFRKLLARSRESGDPKELVSSVKAYLDRAKFSEKSGLEEAVKACGEAAELFEGRGDAVEACSARGMAVGTYIWMNEVDKAMRMATEMQASAKTVKVEVKAARLVLDCHFALGELDKAVEAATSAKDGVQKKGDPEALCEAWGLVVATEIARGDFDAAVTAATSATSSADKLSKAKAWLLVAESQMALGGNSESEATKKSAYEAAIAAQTSARVLFKELGLKKEEAEALQGVVQACLVQGNSTTALQTATELQAFAKDAEGSTEGMSVLAATASQLVATAHLQQYSINGAFLEGGGEAMIAAAREAVASFDRLGEAGRRAGAQRVLLQVRRAFPSTN